MPIPATIIQITDLVAGISADDILADQAQALLKEPSLVFVLLNREVILVLAQVKIGDVEVLPLSGMAVNATVGDVPIVPDDLVVKSLGMPGDRVQILGTNNDVAARELRATVVIVAVDDVGRMPTLGRLA